jgi:hypothetical protein
MKSLLPVTIKPITKFQLTLQIWFLAILCGFTIRAITIHLPICIFIPIYIIAMISACCFLFRFEDITKRYLS